MTDQTQRATLTIRIDPSLHRTLSAVADAEGVSMNAVAEVALTREVALRSAELALTYERAAAAMRSVTRPRLAELIDEIAADEALAPEAVPSRRQLDAPTFEAIRARARRVG